MEEICLGEVTALAEQPMTKFHVEGLHLVVIPLPEGGFSVLHDLCTHADARLSDGWMEDKCTVVCPWHFAQFDVRTGEAKSLPATETVRTYESHVRDFKLYVRLGDL